MKYIIALLLLGLFFIPLSSAEENNVCVFGHRVVTSSQTTYNDSNFLQGYNWNNAPYPFLGSCADGNVVMNVTNGGLQCVPLGAASTDYTYINNNEARNNTKQWTNLTTHTKTYYVNSTNNTLNYAINTILSIPSCSGTQVLTNRSGTITCVEDTAGSGVSYNATYDATSKDVTANRTAWFSTYNSSYDAKISMDYTYVNLNIDGNLTNAKAFTMAQYNGNNSLWLSTFNSTYANALNSSFNETRTNALYITLNNASVNTAISDTAYINKSFNETRTNALYVGLNNATLNTALNTYQSTSNTTSSYVPYVGANKNVNITSFNYSRTLFNVYDNGTCGIIRLGGTLFVGC